MVKDPLAGKFLAERNLTFKSLICYALQSIMQSDSLLVVNNHQPNMRQTAPLLL